MKRTNIFLQFFGKKAFGEEDVWRDLINYVGVLPFNPNYNYDSYDEAFRDAELLSETLGCKVRVVTEEITTKITEHGDV